MQELIGRTVIAFENRPDLLHPVGYVQMQFIGYVYSVEGNLVYMKNVRSILDSMQSGTQTGRVERDCRDMIINTLSNHFVRFEIVP